MDQLRANCIVDRGAAEQARLEAIDELDILDTPREEPFDRLSRLICNIFDVPMAIVSIIDGHRQWYKAFDGLAASEVERQDSFCNLLVENPQPLIVPDATQDVRFAQKPAVLGGPKVRFYAGVPLATSDGHVIGTICALDTRPRTFDDRQVEILSDIAHLTMQAIKLSRFATTDSLTGLMSRRAFKDAGDKAMAQAARHGQPLSCITFDIDHFKAINDTYGHPAGDTVIAGVTAACRDVLQQSDLFGRIGGEEFAILLPQTDRRGAITVAERLRGAVAEQNFPLGADSRAVTASFGVAALDPATRDLDCLLANADSALCKAKSSGRNRTVAWQPQEAGGIAGPRRRVLKGGVILFNRRLSTVDCTVRSLGAEGATLDVSSTIGLPDRFALRIPCDKVEVNCRVVGLAERHLEVEFV